MKGIFRKLWRKVRPARPIAYTPMPMLEKHEDKCIVIGNGPSLAKTIEKYGDEVKKMEKIAVNFMARSPLFDELKPCHYCLIDPMFLQDKEHTRGAVIELYDILVEKTQWPMNLVMPISGKYSLAYEVLSQNKNITFYFCNDKQLVPKSMSRLEAWGKNLVCPPSYSVTACAIWAALYWGYKEVYVVGIDSTVSDIQVDQQTNRVFTIDTHFYKNEEVYENKLFDESCRRYLENNLEQEFFNIYSAHHDYWDLKRWANSIGSKVYNASEFSMIDAFDRKKLK